MKGERPQEGGSQLIFRPVCALVTTQGAQSFDPFRRLEIDLGNVGYILGFWSPAGALRPCGVR